jgi:hypothetical protein
VKKEVMSALAGVTLFRQGTGDVPDDTVHAPTPADENEKLKEQCKYITYGCIVLSSHIYIHLYVVKSSEDNIEDLLGLLEEADTDGVMSDVTKLKGDVAKLNDVADENKKLKEQRKYFTYDCIVLSSHIFICI